MKVQSPDVLYATGHSTAKEILQAQYARGEITLSSMSSENRILDKANYQIV
jgi:hypothetical protein